MMEAQSDKKNQRDPVIEHFVELRKYIEHSHDGLSGQLGKVESRLEKVEVRLETVDSRLGTIEVRLGTVESRLVTVESGQRRLERKLDSGLERVERKLDSLIDARRAPRRRRKP